MPLAINAVTVTIQRSLADNCSSLAHTSPNSTSSFNSANFGANAPSWSIPAVTFSIWFIPSFPIPLLAQPAGSSPCAALNYGMPARVYPLFQLLIFLRVNRLQPFVGRAVCRNLYRQMLEPAIFSSAVPMANLRTD